MDKNRQGHEESVGPEEQNPGVEVRYLDLDGDGVPDAVETTQTVPLHVGADGGVDAVQIIDEIDGSIDDDGVPHTVRVTEKLGLDLDHDGVADVNRVVSFGRSSGQE
jgi:hypothetical protein